MESQDSHASANGEPRHRMPRSVVMRRGSGRFPDSRIIAPTCLPSECQWLGGRHSSLTVAGTVRVLHPVPFYPDRYPAPFRLVIVVGMTPIAKLPAYLKQPPSLLDCGKCLAIVIGADMSETAKQAASYADLLDLPEHLVGEILAGQLHTHPRPAPKHAIAYSALGGNLWNPFQHGKGGPGGWWIIDEPELHLGADILVPDLAGCRIFRTGTGLGLRHIRQERMWTASGGPEGRSPWKG